MKNIIFSIIILLSLTGLGFAQGEKPELTCDLEKDVPLGQVVNQTEYTSAKILKAAREAADAAARAVKAAKRTTELTDSCQTSNCQSNCASVSVSIPKPGFPPASLCGPSPDYLCDQKIEKRHGQKILDEGLSRRNCRSLPNDMDIETDKYYAVFLWRGTEETPINLRPCEDQRPQGCTPGFGCVFQNYYHTGREIVENDFSKKDCENLPNGELNIPNSEEVFYAIFQYDQGLDGVYDGWCNLQWPTCFDLGYDKGECNIEWSATGSICQTQNCGGNACNFTEINSKTAAVSQAAQIAKDSYEKISKIIHDKVAELPLVGNICKVPGLGILCQFSSYKTELETILALQKKSIINARSCWNDPKDYEKILSGEKSGKFLFRCQELSPYYLEKCYPDNFYCCY